MAAMDLSAVMDAIAATILSGSIVERAHAWPAESVSPPCAVVGYPTELDFNQTYADGSDRAVFPVYLLVGKAHTESARDTLSDLLGNAQGIKGALDGNLGGVVQSAHLQRVRIEEVTVGAIAYLSATGDLEVYT